MCRSTNDDIKRQIPGEYAAMTRKKKVLLFAGFALLTLTVTVVWLCGWPMDHARAVLVSWRAGPAPDLSADDRTGYERTPQSSPGTRSTRQEEQAHILRDVGLCNSVLRTLRPCL